MVNNLVRKQGVPALAYPTHDVSVSWECRLRIVKLDAQFMVSLEYPLQRHDINDERLIILRYEGDNLVPRKNSFSGIKFSPSATLLTVLGRNGSHRLRTLSLTLKEPCSVWYPKEPSSLHADFPKFLELARTTGIDIVFDTKWLGSNFNEFQGIFNGSQEFARIPVLPQFTDLYQKADWPILNLIPCAQPGANALTKDLASVAIPSVEDTGPRELAQDVIFDDPPPYKQSKRSGPSPAPDIPISKRLRHSAHSPSPDCATPASQVSSTSTVQVDTFRLTVTSELEKVLPEVLSKYFRDMHASHSRSPSLSPSPPYTRISSTPARHGQTPSHRFTHRADIVRILNSFVTQSLANLFDPTFAQAFDRASDRALDQTLEQASELYNSASIQMEDYVADLRSDLAAASEDHKVALNDYCHQQSEEFAQHIREQKEEVEAQCHEAVLKAEDKLDMVKQALSTSRCLYSVNGRQSAPDKGRRAVSLPLLKEDDERIANE